MYPRPTSTSVCSFCRTVGISVNTGSASSIDRFKNVGNRVAVELYRQRLLIVTASIAYIAEDVHIRKEVHLDALLAITLAGLATSSAHVERESSPACSRVHATRAGSQRYRGSPRTRPV